MPGSFPMRYIGPFSLLEETFANHFGKMARNGIYWHLIVSGSTPEMPFVPAHKGMVGKNLKATKESVRAHAVTVGELMTADLITVRARVRACTRW